MEHTLILQPVSKQPLTVPMTSIDTQVELSTTSETKSTDRPFIQANTIQATVEELSKDHMIPVFIKDNEPLISHADFVQATMDVVGDMFHGETILEPAIRVSHPIKGRVPDARKKAVKELEDWEKTIYYERMAFVIEVPTISDVIGGNKLSLTIGGVKAYNLDNLNSRKGSDEHFKVFIGFENKVCTNLCVWSDGTMLDVRVKNVGQLMSCIRSLIQQYNQQHHLFHLKEFCNYALTEQQFATLIGRCRMFSHLPNVQRNQIPPLMFGDTQIGLVCKDFYKDNSFCRDRSGNINLWRLYNLLTSANKTTYIDSFAERGSNAFDFTFNIKDALQSNTYNWYLS